MNKRVVILSSAEEEDPFEPKYHIPGQMHTFLCGRHVARGGDGRMLIDETTTRFRGDVLHSEMCPECMEVEAGYR